MADDLSQYTYSTVWLSVNRWKAYDNIVTVGCEHKQGTQKALDTGYPEELD